MLMESGEEPQEAEFWQARIEPFLRGDLNQFWVAIDEFPQLLGFLFVRGNRARRLNHSGLLVVGIRQDHWGQGIATRLFNEVEPILVCHELTRIELTVVVANIRAIDVIS